MGLIDGNASSEKNIFKRIGKKIANNYSKTERRDFPFVAAFLVIPVVQLLIFYFAVNLSALVMAFQNSETGAFTFENIRAVIQSFVSNQDRWGNQPASMLLKSVIIWIVGHVLFQPFNLLTCFILTRHIKCGNFFRAIYSIPGIIGVVVFSTIMKDFYAYDGLITTFLVKSGVNLPVQVIRNGLLGSEQTAFITVLIQNTIFGLAGGSIIMAGAFMRIPEDVFEAANLDGCGLFRETFQIAIPCAWGTVTTTMLFALCSFFTADISMYIYSNGTGKFGLNSIGYYIYAFTADISSSGGSVNLYNYASAFGMFITMITLPVVLLGRFLLSRMNDSVEF